MTATAEIPHDPSQIFMHYVGTYPAASADEALEHMLTDETKDRVFSVPDGETAHPNWIVDQIESYRSNPAFELVTDGDWSDYNHCPSFKVARGHTLTPEDTDLHYHDYAKSSWDAFDRARRRVGNTAIRYQVGIPSPLDMSLFTLGQERGMDEAAIEAFTEASLNEIEKIHNEPFGKDVVYQIETPASLSIALQVADPAFRQGLAKRITDFVRRAPEDTHFGVHLCVGDLNNEAREQPQTRKASVDLMNALADMWPEGRHFDYVHEPVAAGSEQPLLTLGTPEALQKTLAMYKDLKDVRLDPGTRYIAGMIHEDQDFPQQRKVLEIIKAFLPEGQQLGVAAGCGLGRRPADKAQQSVERGIELSK